MKIVSLHGSPRKNGNSSKLAGIVTDTLAKNSHEIVHHHLNDLSYKGCQACMACKGKSEECILKDDLSPVLLDIKNADVLLLATPVYWGDITAQMKGFIDRTYSFLTPNFMTDEIKHRLPIGKKLVFIQTQGAPEEMYGDIFPRYNGFFEHLNMFDETHFIRGCGINEKDAVSARTDLIEQAKKIGNDLS